MDAGAAAPLGCIESSAGARRCLSDVRLPVGPGPVLVGPHPATVPVAPRPYQSVGQQVVSIPLDDLLPWLQVRRSPNFDWSFNGGRK